MPPDRSDARVVRLPFLGDIEVVEVRYAGDGGAGSTNRRLERVSHGAQSRCEGFRSFAFPFRAGAGLVRYFRHLPQA